MHATTQLTKPRGDIENNILTKNSSHKYIYTFSESATKFSNYRC